MLWLPHYGLHCLGKHRKKIPKDLWYLFVLPLPDWEGGIFLLWKMSKDSHAFGFNYIEKWDFSLKITAFRASQMPQWLRKGRSLIFLFLWSCNQVLQASSIEVPFQEHVWPKEDEEALQVWIEKGHPKNRCGDVSSSPLQREHQLDPSIPMNFILSHIGTFCLKRNHMNNISLRGHSDFHIPFHHHVGTCWRRLVIRKE